MQNSGKVFYLTKNEKGQGVSARSLTELAIHFYAVREWLKDNCKEYELEPIASGIISHSLTGGSSERLSYRGYLLSFTDTSEAVFFKLYWNDSLQ